MRIYEWIKGLQRFTNRIWYVPFIGFLAAIDVLVILVPTDGILISSSMLLPRRWFAFAFSIAVGSTVGALVLAALVQYHGLPWVLEVYPGMNETATWIWTMQFFDKYGLLLVFAVAMTPFFQQPAIILASLADARFTVLALIIFSGRLIKFGIVAYVASHAPRLLSKMWGVKGEMKGVGIQIKE